MARQRNIKPGMMSNEDLAECSMGARLLWAYLFMLADREGRLEDRPKRIKAQALPYDDGVDVDAMLGELARAGFIVRYVVDGKRYLHIPNFEKHQNCHHREPESTIPAPDAPGNAEASPGTSRQAEESPKPAQRNTEYGIQNTENGNGGGSARERDDELARKLLNAAGKAVRANSQGIVLLTEPYRWIADGLDIDRDCLPVIEAVAATRKPGSITGWTYFTEPIRRERAKRDAPLPEIEPHAAGPPRSGDPYRKRVSDERLTAIAAEIDQENASRDSQDRTH